MAMGETYTCPSANCNRSFTKAYELRKHKATHDDPDSVYHCSKCDFITLQRKNLEIHFAIHTGEKAHQCPDMIESSDSLRCDYRTNDPAALSKHRKKVHGYVPQPNRGRTRKAASGDAQKKDDKVTRRVQRSRRPLPVARRNLSRVPPTTTNNHSDPGHVSNTDEDAMDVDHNFCGKSWFESDGEMCLNSLYDPSLCSQWMAEYEKGYSTFEATGLNYIPESGTGAVVHTATNLDAQTVPAGREGCLCPEWMVEAGIEGWDKSVLEPQRECHVLDA